MNTIALISHASKVMLKILQVRLQQYMNCELPNVQAGFRKGRGQIQDNTTSIITNTIITKSDLKFLYSSLCLGYIPLEKYR